MDKGYYDYDYKKVEKEEQKIVTIEDTRMSDEEVGNLWARIRGMRKTEDADASRAGELQEPLTAGELQELVIKDLQTRNKNKEG